ncbi:FtsK/SpoIIIE domain-containing protein [Arcobacter sp. YIC-80]|uniref:FtsK/SpoIIIE domain-containing protein n=1 Tax=Arcobacter sp. YIC-80 TaxID=3376683 RepID=UPI00384B1A93
MNKEITIYHLKKVSIFFIVSVILFFIISAILVINTDIINQSYINKTTLKQVPKHYIITDKNGDMYSIDLKEKSLLNRDFVVHSKVQFENIMQEQYEFSIKEYFNNLFNYKLSYSYSQEIKNTNFILCYLGAMALFIYLLYNYIKHIKYYLIPIHFNIFNTIGIEPKQKKVYDRFVKLSDNQIIYKNCSKINYDIYVKELDNIKQYLNLKDESLEVERYKDKSISIIITQLPNLVPFDKSKLQKGKIHLGIDKHKQDFYIDIQSMTHYITVATTGAGKSVYTQNLLLSLFYNHEKVDKFYLIDPKRAEFGRYKKLKKVHYASSDEEILNTFKELQEIMYQRYDEMESDSLDSGDVLYQGNYIFMVMG